MRARSRLWSVLLVVTAGFACAEVPAAPDARNPSLRAPTGVAAELDDDGAALDVAGHSVRAFLAAIGRDGARVPLDPRAHPRAIGPEVRYQRAAGVVEWWRALAAGLEHGVDLAARPAGAGDLFVDVAFEGALRPSLDRGAIQLLDRRGTAVASYSQLAVLDANGARVPARFELQGELVRIRVDDASARYPLVVDPLVAVEEAVLIAGDAERIEYAGSSIAISGDGTRAFLGMQTDIMGPGMTPGTVRVFERSVAGAWSEVATLRPPDSEHGDGFGAAMAVSDDGNRAVIGVPYDDVGLFANAGSARIFVRDAAGAWSQEAALIAPGAGRDEYWGTAVAISADGTRAVVSSPVDGRPTGGGANVFVRGAGGSWALEAQLISSDVAPGEGFGTSVAISAAGDLLIVGVPGDILPSAPAVRSGSVRVFARSGAVWTEAAVIAPPPAVVGERFGSSVALAPDGSRALIGAPQANVGGAADAGAAHVFVRGAGGTWTEDAMLTAPMPGFFAGLGSSVALSADATRALVGAPRDDVAATTDAGSAWLFLRGAAGAWTAETRVFAPDLDSGGFGADVALSAAGDRALVSHPADGTPRGDAVGSARVFNFEESVGGACMVPSDCASGFCVDGVCCDTACGDGALDCQGCSAALTGGPDGTCASLSVAVAPTITCRPASGACDIAELCATGATSCPADVAAPDGTPCANMDLCDGAESCLSGACAAGMSLDCDDGDACTSDSCDAASGCTHEMIAGCPGTDAGTGPDAGTDAGPADDAGPRPTDAGPRPDASAGVAGSDGGCACRTAGASRRGWAPWIAIGLFALVLSRRARRR